MQSHYQNIQAQRQAELDNKRNKILVDMNRKAEQQKALKEKKKRDALKSQRIKEEEKEKKLQDREAERKRMREDMQKRKAMAAKGKKSAGASDIEVEIAGAEKLNDLINESMQQDDGMMSTQQYFEANQNARVEKMQKAQSTESDRTVDPFKQEAKKFQRAGWGNAKAANEDNEKKTDK